MKPSRIEGFAPIGDYAVLGDGRTVALVCADGRVDWWPVPALDSPPICAALLDPDSGGHFRFSPTLPFTMTRAYVPGTNVLETTYTVSSGTARMTDSLNIGLAGLLPWNELARRVEGLSGYVELEWEFVAGDRFGESRPWVRSSGTTPLVTVGDQTLALVVDGGEPNLVTTGRVTGRLRVEQGGRALVAVVAADHEPLFLAAPEAIDGRIDGTIEWWRRWTSNVEYSGPWHEAVLRSAIVLKTLLCEPAGAIAAAATTSLPERIGGDKNWDYRFAWIRDSSFMLDACIELDLHEEVQAAVSWILGVLERNQAKLQPFYTLSGEVPEKESQLDAPGYRQSRPVRAGNDATSQLQLGNYGDLLDTIYRYVSAGHILDRDSARLLADLVDRCCDAWTSQDSGIWELHRVEHYTISKMGCWVALDRATSLAEAGQLPNARVERWRAEADAIKSWVNANCWSESRHSYTSYAGTNDIDAAVLLAGRTGFERGPRLRGTIEAVTEELGDGPLFYRYSGMPKEEGAFVACTFWMVEALAWTGQLARATRLMDVAVELTSDLGLLSEEIDPASGEFLGNFPQGLSHLALINAAHSLESLREK